MLPVVDRSIPNSNQNCYRYTTTMGAGAAYIVACELGLPGLASTAAESIYAVRRGETHSA